MANIVKKEVQLSELKQIEPSLNKLVQMQLPVKISYRLSKVLKKISQELNTLEETRQTLVKKLGVLNEDTQQIEVPQDRVQDFVKEMEEVLSESYELEFIPIDIEEITNVTLSPADVINLEMFFEAESE